MTTSRWLLPVLGLVALAACTNEKIVFKTREPFNPPPDSVNGFLGYFTVGTKQTTCGNCHVGVQTNWVATKHADAWADLQASGHASSSCYGCHSVSERGNNVGHPAGYNVKADTAYQDVQCENCHGPGNTHVQNPSLTNRPLASIEVDTGKANGCGGCHTGTHEPFVDQWIQSAHGSGPGYAVAAANATCAPCHEGKTALAVKFNVTTNYVERDSAKTERIVCVVCHDPHGGPNAGQLRASISTPTIDNLCVRCHSRSGVPPWGVAALGGTARGAHGAQGLLVLGQNVGWFPPNFAYDTTLIVSSHGTQANPRLCATCHVAQTTITASNGGFVFQSVGHLFEAVPCTDSNGIPIPGSCAVSQRDFSACSNSTCHIGGPGVARAAYITIIQNIDNLLDQLWVDVNGNSTIDAGDTLATGTPAGLLPAMVIRGTAADSAALSFGTNVTTTAKGALWNAALAATDDRQYFLGGKVFGRGFATHMASGNGVHNPFLLQALLSASIDAVRTEYGLPAPPHYNTTLRATMPPGVRMRIVNQSVSSR